MKTVIIYASKHHGNTKKLVDALASGNDITVIDASEENKIDLSGYDLIGFASGIAFGKYYPQIITFAEKYLPNGKDVFFIHTAGNPRENQNFRIKNIAEKKDCKCSGTYFCKGFDTYGPFKLIGGINKSHPDDEDIRGVVNFFEDVQSKGAVQHE